MKLNNLFINLILNQKIEIEVLKETEIKIKIDNKVFNFIIKSGSYLLTDLLKYIDKINS